MASSAASSGSSSAPAATRSGGGRSRGSMPGRDAGRAAGPCARASRSPRSSSGSRSPSSISTRAGALVHVFTDGSVQVNHGGTEMGQGLYVKVAQVVAEELGIGADRVRITATRTDKVPNTAATAASAGSDLNGNGRAPTPRAPSGAVSPGWPRACTRCARPTSCSEAAWCGSARSRSPSSGLPASRSPSACRCPPPATTRPRRSPGTATPRAGAPSSTSPAAPRAPR